MNQPAFSRSGNSMPFGGKRTERMQTYVDVATKEVARTIWTSAGYPSESEWLADLVAMVCHWEAVVAKLHAKRLKLALGKGGE